MIRNLNIQPDGDKWSVEFEYHTWSLDWMRATKLTLPSKEECEKMVEDFVQHILRFAIGHILSAGITKEKYEAGNFTEEEKIVLAKVKGCSDYIFEKNLSAQQTRELYIKMESWFKFIIERLPIKYAKIEGERLEKMIAYCKNGRQ